MSAKYEPESAMVLEITQGHAVCLLVVAGRFGHGLTISMRPEHSRDPKLRRAMASALSDVAKELLREAQAFDRELS